MISSIVIVLLSLLSSLAFPTQTAAHTRVDLQQQHRQQQQNHNAESTPEKYTKMDPVWTLAVIWILLSAALPDVVLTSRNADFTRQPSLDNHVYNEHLLWTTTSTSTLGCAEMCATDLECRAFTSTKVTSDRIMTCRGHSQAVASGGLSTPATKVYSLVGRATVPSWLKSVCTGNDECNQTNSECFASKCLCTPGYYYSHSRDSCLPDCKDLQSTFVAYPLWYVYKNNLASSINTWKGCHDSCLTMPDCVTFEYNYSTSKCYVADVTALDKPESWNAAKSNNLSYWQKTCF